MKKLLLLPILALALSLSAQSITIWPNTTSGSPAQIPIYGTKGCVAIVNSQNDQRVNWSVSPSGATLITAATPSITGPQEASLYSTATGTYTLTATSRVGGLTASCVIKFIAAPTPIACSSGAPDTPSCHPRFYATPSTIAGMQSAKGGSNPLYTSGIKTLADGYVSSFSTYFTWSTWSGSACTGGSGPSSDISQDDIELAAYYISMAALLDSNATNRNTYGCKARDLFMALTNYVGNGTINLELAGGRWADGAGVYGWEVPADNLMAGGYLSSADIAAIRAFFLAFAQQIVWNQYGNGISPSPTATLNAPSLFVGSGTGTGYPDSAWTREAGNNYTHARILITAVLALTFDDNTTDDPTVPTGSVVLASVAVGGSSWTVGEQATVGGGAAVVQCTAVTSGACTAVSIITPSTGYNNASNPIATTRTSGSGTGLTLNIFAGNTCGATRYGMCADSTGGSLHAYWNWVAGSLMYLDWATMEDATVAQTSLNTAFGNMSSAPTCNTGMASTTTMPCLGINQGGEAVEGLLYGGSVDKLRWGLNFIHNAGYDDPHLWGPQMSLEDSPFWDLRYVADATALVSLNSVSGSVTGEAGPGAWDYLSDGDALDPYVYPSYLAQDAALLAYDSYLPTPRTDRTNALSWIVLNSAFGMADGTAGACTARGLYCGFMAGIANDYGRTALPGVFFGLPAGNPVTTSPPTDPRPSMPTDWYDIGNKHLALRNNWSSGYTVFDFLATDTQIDHEHEFDGRFEVNANGYWLTKGRQPQNDYNTWTLIANYENEVGIINSTGSWPTWDQSIFGPTMVLGGQNWHSEQAGLTPFAYSDLPAYAAMHVDSTNAYNGNSLGFTDVTGAIRDVIYNRSGNVVAVYDRTSVGHAASTQISYFDTTGAVTFTGSQGCWPDRSGTQKACYTPVYPSGATVTAIPWYNSFSYTVPNLNLQNGTTMQVGNCIANYQNGSTQNCLTYPDQLQGLVAQWASYTPGTYTACPYASISSTGLITAAGSGTGQCQIYAGYTFVGLGSTPATLLINVVSGSSGGGTVTSNVAGQAGSDWQPEYYIKVVPSGTPTSTNFGAAFQWGSSSFTPITTSAVASSSGQTFDGILAGTTAYWFMRSLATFTGVTYPASAATTQYVADLAPNTLYAISGTGAPGSATTDNAGTLTFSAAGTGNITISPTGITAPPINLSGTVSLSGKAVLP